MENVQLRAVLTVQDPTRLAHLQAQLGAAPDISVAFTEAGSLDELWALFAQPTFDVFFIDADLLDNAYPEATPFYGKPRRPVVLLFEQSQQDKAAAALRTGTVDCQFWENLDPFLLQWAVLQAQERSRALASPREFQAMVENAQDIITVLDANGRIRYESPSVHALLGYAPEQMIGRVAFEYVHPDDLERIFDIFLEGIRIPHRVATATYRFRHQDGSWRTMESRAVNLLEDPHIRGVVINSRDVTEQQQAEERLRDSEQRFRAVFNSMYSFMGVLAPDGTVLSFNQSALDFLERPDSDVVGMPFWEGDWWATEEQKQNIRHGLEAAASGVMVMEEAEVQGPHGLAYIEMAIKAVFDDEGNVVMFIPEGRDVTERKWAEQAFQKSQRHKLALLEAIPDLIVHMTANGKILSIKVPPGFKLSVDPENVMGQHVANIVPPQLVAMQQEVTREALATGQMQTRSYTIDFPDGTTLYREARVIPCATDEVIWVIRDFTDLQQNMAALRKSESHKRAMLSAFPDAVLHIAQDGTCLNVRLPITFDEEAETGIATGQPVSVLFPKLLVPLAMRRFKMALETKRLQRLEYQIGDPESPRTREVRMVPCGDNEVLMVIHDITKSKRTQREVVRLKAFYEQVLDDLPEDLAVLTPDGRILYLNPAIVPDTDLRLSLVGQPWMDACQKMGFDHASGKAWLARFKRVVKEQCIVQHEETLTAPDGSVRHFLRFAGPVFDKTRAITQLIVYGLDITERKNAEIELRASAEALRLSREELRQLAQYLQEVREEERTRISREVHDVIGQALTALRMETAWVERGLLDEQEALHGRLESIKSLIDDTIHTVRRIATELRPGILDDLGLSAALDWQIQEFARRTNLTYSLTDTTDGYAPPRAHATALFRIFQETLTNVARHAHASHVCVRLSLEDDHLILTVKDNGQGFQVEETTLTHSLGLMGMRERAQACNGSLQLESTPGDGTRMTASMPLPALPP